MTQAVTRLWEMVRSTPQIDVKSLARAVEQAAAHADDFRTRLLIRDSILAIQSFWGTQSTSAWISSSPVGAQIQEICQRVSREASEDEHGFPSLRRRIVDAIDPDVVLQYFRDLGQHVVKPTPLMVGGSIALILQRHLARQTEDIDVVDEVPPQIRSQHALLHELDARYGLQLTHFQSHYLPSGWQQRVHSIGNFGELQVYAVDLYDMFLSKLFSLRIKDRDDLRALLPRIDRNILADRFRLTTSAFRSEEKLMAAAKANWYVLYGDGLPQ